MLPVALLPVAVSCSLAGTDVEPGLPTGRISGGNTLVYRANDRPVVAHNDSSFGTIIISVLGGRQPVNGFLDANNVLTIRAVDFQNVGVAGQQQHTLHLVVPGFRGQGSYALAVPGTTYQEDPYTDARTLSTGQSVPFFPVASAPQQLVVTVWDTTARRLQGTFRFTAAAPTTGQAVVLTDGRFDVLLD